MDPVLWAKKMTNCRCEPTPHFMPLWININFVSNVTHELTKVELSFHLSRVTNFTPSGRTMDFRDSLWILSDCETPFKKFKTHGGFEQESPKKTTGFISWSSATVLLAALKQNKVGGEILGKNTVYSIPEILFWKIRNEFLIYHTWNNGISEKIWKISNVYRPKAPPTTFRGAQRAQFFWGTLYVFLLPTKNCKMTRIDHPKIELLSKYTEHVWERCFP